MRRLAFVMLSALLLFGACGESQAPSPTIEPGGLALVGAQLIDGSGGLRVRTRLVSFVRVELNVPVLVRRQRCLPVPK